MTIVQAWKRDVDQAESEWDVFAAPRRGHVIAVRDDAWQFGKAEMSDKRFAFIKVDLPIEDLGFLLQTDAGQNNIAVQHAWRRCRLDLDAVFRIPGAIYRNGVVEIPTDARANFLGAVVEDQSMTNPQVIK